MIYSDTCAFLTCVRALLSHAGIFVYDQLIFLIFFFTVSVYNSLSFGNLFSTFQLNLCVVVVLMICSCADADVRLFLCGLFVCFPDFVD